MIIELGSNCQSCGITIEKARFCINFIIVDWTFGANTREDEIEGGRGWGQEGWGEKKDGIRKAKLKWS